MIAIVTSEFPPMPAAAAARVAPWYEELVAQGCKVTIFTSRSVTAIDSNIVRSIFPTPNNKSNLISRFFQEIFLGLDLGFRMWKMRKTLSCCIISSPPFFMSCMCVFFAQLGGVSYAFDVRDRYPKVLYDLSYFKSIGIIKRLLDLIEFSVYKNAKFVCTVTKGLFDDLKNDFPQKKSRFSLVRNGFDERIFNEKILSISKRKKFTVVYHGRLGKFYDSSSLIEVINMVNKSDPSVQFLLIGDMPISIREKFSKNVEFMESLPLNDLAKVLSTCHLGICILQDLPAMKNAFPAKAYDYIGAGLPILIAPNGELAEMTKQSGIGLSFQKVDPREITGEIIKLKNNHEKWGKLESTLLEKRSMYGRRLASRHFLSALMKKNCCER